jgi:hypothetical protein
MPLDDIMKNDTSLSAKNQENSPHQNNDYFTTFDRQENDSNITDFRFE